MPAPTPAATVRADPAPAPADTRPLLRGWIHLVAFVVTVIAAPFVVARAPSAGTAAALAVYMTSIAALFGVSAAFHRVRWSPRRAGGCAGPITPPSSWPSPGRTPP